MKKNMRNDLDKIQDRVIEFQKKVKEVYSELHPLVSQIYSDFEEIRQKHSDVYENRSEKWQESEAGEAHSAEMNIFDELERSLEELADSFDPEENSELTFDGIVETIEELKCPAD